MVAKMLDKTWFGLTFVVCTLGGTACQVVPNDELVTSSSDSGAASPPGVSTYSSIEDIAEQLNSFGIHNLCHPHSDAYAPVFPRCHALQEGSSEPSDERFDHIRRLEEKDKQDEENFEKRHRLGLVLNAIGAFVCVIVAAVSSGLTVGLLAMDPLLLSIKVRAGATKEEREEAALLVPLIKQHHLLLVTLLLMTSVAGESLPIFLHDLVPEFAAVVISVVLVLFVGEILPSALFTGPKQLRMASRFAPVVRLFMWLLYPVAFPIARILDCVLSDEDDQGNAFNRGELSALIRIQYEERLAAKQRRKSILRESVSNLQTQFDPEALDESFGSAGNASLQALAGRRAMYAHKRTHSIHMDEVTMVEGALQMRTKATVDIFVSYHKVYSVARSLVLDERSIVDIFSSGYSRVPVYDGEDKTQIRGILMTRQLIVVNTDDECPVARLPLHVPLCVGPDMNLVDLINVFQTGGRGAHGGHMALVCARPEVGNAALADDDAIPKEAGLMGIVTLEDALECLLQEQIYDEMDAAGRAQHTRSAADMGNVDGSDGNYNLMT